MDSERNHRFSKPISLEEYEYNENIKTYEFNQESVGL